MKKKDLEWKLQLQLFGEGDGGEGGTDPAGGADPGAGDNPAGGTDPAGDDDKKKTPKSEAKYTDEDVDRILNKKFAAWEKNKQKEIDEAQRLANMSAEEKQKEQMKRMQRELDEMKSANAKAKMGEAARTILAEMNVPAPDSIVNLLVTDSADTTKSAVEAYAQAFQDEVSKAVKEALKGTEPAKSGSGSPSGLTKEQILAVQNRAERQRLINENPKLFGI